jgi:hypothetical protein
MTALSGLAGSVVWFDGSDAVVGEIAEWSLDLSGAVVAVTAFGDGEDRYVPNLARAVGSFSGNFDPDDAGQVAMRAALGTGTPVRLILASTAADYVDTLAAFVSGAKPAIGVSGKVEMAYDFQVRGRIDTSTGLALLLAEDDDLVLLEDGAGIRIDTETVW